jgi:hypothetical protein
MKNSFRFFLEKSSRKFRCTRCNQKSFVRYLDSQTKTYLPEHYGRCDHESKCGYHLNPYKDGYLRKSHRKNDGLLVNEVNKVNMTKNIYFREKVKSESPVFLPFDVVKETLTSKGYGRNTFIQNLLNSIPYPFEVSDVEKVIAIYYLGTVSSGYRTGAITFPFINKDGNICAVQVKQFDKTNHTIATDKLDKVILNDFKRKQVLIPEWLSNYIDYGDNNGYFNCLFGEHLLKRFPNNPIGLVEAPKTAVYCALYFGLPENPKDIIWLAVYNKSSFTLPKLNVLAGRTIITFPDASPGGRTYNEWKNKADCFERELPGTVFIFSCLLERCLSEKEKYEGKDLADALVKLDWRKFRKNIDNPEKLKLESHFNQSQVENILPANDNISWIDFDDSNDHYPIKPPERFDLIDWGERRKELDDFFAKC